MKTMKDWKTSLDVDFNWGDEVDTEIIDHVIECLPPRTMNGNMVQMGEQYSFNHEGRPTYITFVSNGQFTPHRKWYYAGAAIAGCKDVQKATLDWVKMLAQPDSDFVTAK